MTTDSNNPHQYNYQPLNSFLTRTYDPQAVGNELDQIMADLVHLASLEEEFCRTLGERHYLLRELRDLFWNLKKE